MVQQILHGQLWRICVRCIRGRDLLWDRETASYIDRIKNLHVSKNFLLLPVLKPIQANTARELLNFIFSVSDLLHAHAQYLALIIWFLYPPINPWFKVRGCIRLGSGGARAPQGGGGLNGHKTSATRGSRSSVDMGARAHSAATRSSRTSLSNMGPGRYAL